MDPVHITKREAARGAECESRRQLSCGRIDIKLGWPDRIPIDVCDECWKAGPSSHDGYAIRQARIDEIVAGQKARPIEDLHPLVRVSIMGRFMTENEAAAAKLRLAAAKIEAEQDAKRKLWDGVPYPVRLVTAAGSAVKGAVQGAGHAFKRKLSSYKGCGCLKPLKKLVTRKSSSTPLGASAT